MEFFVHTWLFVSTLLHLLRLKRSEPRLLLLDTCACEICFSLHHHKLSYVSFAVGQINCKKNPCKELLSLKKALNQTIRGRERPVLA